MRSKLLFAAVVAAALLPFLPALLRGEIYTFRDHSDYFIPLRHYTAQQLTAGDLPLWNPLNGSGERWLANPQTAVFYPPALLFLALPFATAYVLYLAFHVALLAAGAFALFRRWSEDPVAGFGSVSLALAGPVMSLLDVSNNLGTFAWLPLVILAALRRGDADRGWPLPVSAFLLAAMFLGGEPFLALIGAAIFAVTMLASAGRSSLPAVAVTGGLTILLCAAQLLPFGEMLIGSDRAAGFASELAFRESMHPADWALLSLSPALTGGGLIPSSQGYIPILYVGASVMLLAIAGLFSAISTRNGTNRTPVFAWAGLLVAVIAISAGRYLGTGAELLAGLGMDLNRYPSRLVPLGALAVAALATLGAASLREIKPTARIFAVVSFALILLVALLKIAEAGTGVRVEPALLLGAELAILGWFLARPARFTPLALLALITIADLVLAGAPLRQSAAWPREEPAVAALVDDGARVARLADLDRLPADIRYDSLPGYTNLSSRIASISSPAPVSDARYIRFHDHALYTPDAARLRFLSAGHLITTRSLSMSGMSSAGAAGPIRVYTFDSVWPAVTVWDESGPSFLRDGDVRTGMPREPLSDASAMLLRMDRDEVLIRVSTPRPSVVVLNQLDASGWSVTVDGVRADPLREGGMFRAVRVPPGEHTVRWHYMPGFFLPGVVISVITVLLLGAMTIHLFIRARGVVGWRSHANNDDSGT